MLQVNPSPSLRLRISALAEPAFLLTWAIYHFFLVIFDTVVLKANPAGILQLQEVKDKAFSNFWNAFTAPSAGSDELTGSAALIPPLFAKASGNILHIGPGSGTQVQCFNNPTITKLFLAEPAKGLHASLEANVRQVPHLQNKHQILACGADATAIMRELEGSELLKKQSGLFNRGEPDGLFDTIVCVRVLCSIPLPKEAAVELYSLLKPGGKFLIAEHVKNPWLSREGNVLGRLAQVFYMSLGWKFFLGGCCMNRNTKKTLDDVAKKDGGWETDDVRWSFGWGPLPYIAGELQKRSI